MNKTAQSNQKKMEKALVRMLHTTPPDRISVSDVCDAAGVSRTTFYHHYERMDDVLYHAYETAHQNAFGRSEWTIDYFQSDAFIRDMISFFDDNTELLQVLYHWDLLSRITSLPTRKSLVSASEEEDEILARYPEYTMIYFWDSCFRICSMWMRKGKKETPEELFQIIRHMRSL